MSTTPTDGNAATKDSQAESLPGLLPHHLADLRKSGLSDETIIENGIYSESNYDTITAQMNLSGRGRGRYARRNGPAAVFPFFDEHGTVVMHRFRPDNPPLNSKGRPAKYLSPKGVPPRVYFPKRVWDAINTKGARLFITEGEKKSLKSTQQGFPCIGLTGVDCYHLSKMAGLLPELERLDWKDRKVFITFDSDATTNDNILLNEELLAAELVKRGAVVKVVRIPGGDNGEKVGIDDFLVAHGVDEFHKLVNAAVEPEPPDPAELRLPASKLDPAIESERFVSSIIVDDVPRLRRWNCVFMQWSSGKYIERDDEEVRAQTIRWLKRNWSHITCGVTTNVMDHIKAETQLDKTIEPPSWLGKPLRDWLPRDILPARNVLIHLPSLKPGKPLSESTIEPTPRFFSTVRCNYEYDPDAPKPVEWERFLLSLWNGDLESIHLLQEWFGLMLVADTRQQRILLLIGPTRSGKGTIARVLRELVGKDNTIAPTLASLASHFGLEDWLGKTVAIVTDARIGSKTNQLEVVERLLNISGEDPVTIPRKFRKSITVRLPARIVVISNELPKLLDSSGALSSRVILLRLTESFLGQEDKNLFDRLLPEMPAIFLWAVAGWKRLTERGGFVQPNSGIGLLEELADLTSPTHVFIRDRCVVDADCRVAVSELFEAWCSWCESKKRNHPGTEATFGRDLFAAVPKLKKIRGREDGSRQQIYLGIELQNSYSGGF